MACPCASQVMEDASLNLSSHRLENDGGDNGDGGGCGGSSYYLVSL